jgi:hypothetical protein
MAVSIILTEHWNVAYTGRWSEKRRGAVPYAVWRRLLPFHKTRSVQAGIRAFSLYLFSTNTSRMTAVAYEESYLSLPRSYL